MILLILILSIVSVYSQNPSCTYQNDQFYGYTCTLSINNPNGFDNFTQITGQHVNGFTSTDVRRVLSLGPPSITINIPSIICTHFINLMRIEMRSLGIDKIDENSFKNCRNITQIFLFPNSIQKIHENAFVDNLELLILDMDSNFLTTLPQNVFRNQRELRTLDLRRNQIESLPSGIFTSMSNLNAMFLNVNNLTTLHGDSFGSLPTLVSMYFNDNRLNAFDERIFNNTMINVAVVGPNPCADRSDLITDRNQIRAALQRCFDNYEERDDQKTTTTESYQCGNGSIDERFVDLKLKLRI